MDNHSKEADDMNAVIERSEIGLSASEIGLSALDVQALLSKTEYRVISSEEALSDIVPMKWDDDVVSGKKMVLLFGKVDKP